MRKMFSAVPFIVLLLLAVLQPAPAAQPSNKEFLKANAQFNKGNYADAVRIYQSLLAAPPRDMPPGELNTRIADCYFRMSDYQNALASYRLALKEQDTAKRAQTQYWIGFCTMLLGRNDEAVREFLVIPERYPDSGMLVSTGYYWAGRASERMGRKEQAAELFRKAAGAVDTEQGRFAMKKAESLKNGAGSK